MISAIPRIILAFLNTEVNDDHITTILLWQQNGIFPSARDCWECFQPPLFYFLVKTINTVTGLATYDGLFTTIQVFNFILSISISWITIWFISTLKLNRLLSVSLALFWALNPELISIGALATNDSLVILLGIITSLAFMRYLYKESLKMELVLFSLLLLLGITKGNGLLFIGITTFIICIKSIYTKQLLSIPTLRRIMLMIVTLLGIAYSGQYVKKHQEFNNPFITNADPSVEKAKWDTPGTIKFRKGVNTIKEAVFHFPIISLLETPYNKNGDDNDQLHRQNIWTQMLGQYSNYVFERHPTRWVSINNDMENFARANIILILGLVAFGIIGLILTFSQNRSTFNLTQVFHLVAISVFILFTINYSIKFRDFSFIKVVFLYPTYISLMALSAKGFSYWSKPKIFSLAAYKYAIIPNQLYIPG